MNIFYLDHDPKICAAFHCDKHVVKMILEYAQILSTAHRLLDGVQVKITLKTKTKINYVMRNPEHEQLLYKVTHQNHPSTVWVRQSSQHYAWLYEMFVSLLEEYTHRYGKVHATAKLVDILKNPPKNLKDNGWVDVTPAMPDEYKSSTALQSYRSYYTQAKKELLSYKNREVPEWVLAGV